MASDAQMDSKVEEEAERYFGIANFHDWEKELKQRFLKMTVLVFKWLLGKAKAKRPLLAGLSAPQGSGKSTISKALEHLFTTHSIDCVTLSLDDFYLRHEDLARLSDANPLYRVRGNPGTHDIALLQSCIEKLLSHCCDSTLLPVYDKAALNGVGERSPEPRRSSGRPDVVVLEGWMMGFQKVQIVTAGGEEEPLLEGTALQRALRDIMPASCPQTRARYWKEVNSALERYEAVFDMVDVWVSLEVESLDCVFSWRLEQERELARRTQKTVMDDERVALFVQTYIPTYLSCLPVFYERCVTYDGVPVGSQSLIQQHRRSRSTRHHQPKPTLRILLNDQRDVKTVGECLC